MDAPPHAKAKAWLETTLSGRETVAFSWNVILAFVRLTTRPGLFRNPLSPGRAFDLVATWLDQPPATVVNPFSALFEGNAYAISWLRASSAVFCHYNRRPDRIGSAPPEVSAPDGPSERAVGAAQHSASAGPTLLRVGEC